MNIRTLISLIAVPLCLAGCNGNAQTAVPPTTLAATLTTTKAVTTSPVIQSSAIKTTATPSVGASTATPGPTGTAWTSVFKAITADELYALVKVSYDETTGVTVDSAPYVTVDARTAIEGWNPAHIPAAVQVEPNVYNTPIGVEIIASALKMLPKGKLVVFYDDNLDLAPALAQTFLDLNTSQNLGFDPANVRILAGGFASWTEKHYPTKSAEQ